MFVASESDMDPRVQRLKTIKSCETFAVNAEKRNYPDLANQARFRASQLRLQGFRDGERRPDIDYHIIGLKNGDDIWLRDLNITASVASHRTLFYQGREIYLTPLEAELIEAGHPSNKVRNNWRVKANDELINDLYNAIYPKS